MGCLKIFTPALSAEVDNQLPLFNLHILIGMDNFHPAWSHSKALISRISNCNKGWWGPKGEGFLSPVTRLSKRMGN